ncbi:MAG: isoleucine--tRNA ligase [Candidatus Woesearchaeota archaeon]
MGNHETTAEKESTLREFWKDQDLLRKLQERRKGGEKYFLLDGPPYANAVPHVGHIRNTVYKDLYIRWNFMKGKDVLFQPGFDTHGLPIENMVEKQLGLKSKKDIQKLGIAEFMRKCKDSAALNKDLWMEVYDLLGSWYSWKKPYLTYENSYIQSVWWSFKQLWEKGMAYEGQRPVFWCPKCETALAGYEATDSYKNVTDPSIYVKFPLKDSEEYLLVYTTTPWTLPSNTSLFVAPDKDYVKAKTEKHGTLILAKNLVKVLDEFDVRYEVIKTFKGKELVGKEYEPLLDLPTQQKLREHPKALKVYESKPILKERISPKVAAKKGIAAGDVYEDFVTVEEGTGIVHCAPGHGKTDNEIGKQLGLPEVSPLDDQCKFTAEAGEFKGEFVKDADHAIADVIHKNGLLLHYGTLEHSYPLCWRCKSPLIFRMSNQWFLKISPIKDEMLEANDKVEWQPGYAKERFGTWVANADDWNFSRQRYWGVPIPIWKSESGKTLVIGSVEELRKHATTEVPDDFDLHTVNDLTLKHPETDEEMTRINDIFDVWYDSGSAPYASLGYPFENKELFEGHYPIDRINESQDQIRGWFYSLMFCNTAVFGKTPYHKVSMPGWVLDKHGEKMSKSQGNVVSAKEALEEVGADAIRFYYCWDIAPEATEKFDMDTLRNDVRRYFTIWQNLVKLAKERQVSFSAKKVGAASVEDQWLLSRLHTTIKEVREAVEGFHLHLAGRSLQRFVMEDLSRTYVQLVRDRMEDDTTPAAIISHALWKVGIVSAAITPYQSEYAYQALKELLKEDMETSVHLETLPVPDLDLMDEHLEEAMTLAGEAIAGILAARDKAQTGVRWPLQEVIIDTDDAETAKAVEELDELVKRQANVRAVKVEHFPVEYKGKPNYKTLGRAYGEQTGDAINAMQAHMDEVIKGVTGKEGKASVEGFEFLREHVQLDKVVPETHASGEFKHGTAYLLKEVPRELEMEGYAREVTRRLQQLRKEAGLSKRDRVDAVVACELADDLQPYWGDIAKKVGADELVLAEQAEKELSYKKEATIKGVKVAVMLEKRA